MRLIVGGGGTGGHLFPGLAVAEAVRGQPGAAVLFVGSAFGIEATAVPRAGYAFEALLIRGARGRGIRGVVGFVAQLPLALSRAWRIIGAFRPTLVLGLGGYGSVPVVLAAWLRRVPSVLLEQNAHPGMANRLLAHLARRVCTTFEGSARFFPASKAVHTGNPVRPLVARQEFSHECFTLFVFGGSQGARAINRAVVEAAVRIRKAIPDLQLIHQTGAADADWVMAEYVKIGAPAQVYAFIHDMADAYARADLVVCRAGATTLAELTALGKAAVLVPYPHAADDHQRTNAEALVDCGAAVLIADGELNGERLAECVIGLARNRERLASMGRAARRQAVPNATAKVLAVCAQVIGEGA